MAAVAETAGIVCPECATVLWRGGRFCHHCGWDSKNAAAGAAATYGSTVYGRPGWKRRTMAAITFVTLGLVLALLLRPGGGSRQTVIPGSPAPDFTSTALDGSTVRLSDLRGKAVLLNFWASWCPPCREEMPYLQEAHERYGAEGLVVLAVNLDESPVAIRSFLDRYNIRLPVLLDRDLHVTERYGIIPLPTSFFIDRAGVVRSKVEGAMDRNRVFSEVRRVLEVS